MLLWLQPVLHPTKLGDSAGLLVGQKVFAIGNPFGLDHTLTSGIISGTGREISSGNTGRPIQASAFCFSLLFTSQRYAFRLPHHLYTACVLLCSLDFTALVLSDFNLSTQWHQNIPDVLSWSA